MGTRGIGSAMPAGLGRGARRLAMGGGLLLWAVLAAGCRYPLDTLYALPLERPPTERDWQQAVPLTREAFGGRSTQVAERDVDSDAVHASTASCHHGVEEPPVAVELRAFHADGRLFVRVDWVDPTESRGPTWAWGEAGWQSQSSGEDGLGLLWGDGTESFSCVQYCHLEDWRRVGQRTLADYTMAVRDADTPVDFWVWRAGRGSVDGSAEDSWLGRDGRIGDGGGPEQSYRANSLREAGGQGGAFGAGDRPVEFPDPGPGQRAPGFLWEPVPAGRTEVASTSRWSKGRWSVVLARAFSGSDADDVVLRPGTEAVFGVAILDAVEKDHLALAEPVRMAIVPRGALDLPQEPVRE